jgi:hypothetical protein
MDDADRTTRTDDDRDEAITPAEFTKRIGDEQAASAGPGAPETVEPTQGRDDDGPSGPPQRDMGSGG